MAVRMHPIIVCNGITPTGTWGVQERPEIEVNRSPAVGVPDSYELLLKSFNLWTQHCQGMQFDVLYVVVGE